MTAEGKEFDGERRPKRELEKQNYSFNEYIIHLLLQNVQQLQPNCPTFVVTYCKENPLLLINSLRWNLCSIIYQPGSGIVQHSRFLLGICHLHNWTLVSVLGRQEEAAAAFMLFLTNFQPWHRFTMCLNAQHFSWIPLCCDVLLQKILQSGALVPKNKDSQLIFLDRTICYYKNKN